MGYYAKGWGTVTIKNDLTAEDFLKLYEAGRKAGSIMLGGQDFFVTNTADFLTAMEQVNEAFDEICVERESEDGKTLLVSLSHDEKYTEELVYETLNLIAPITVDGQIDFVGEDDSMWTFKFENGGFSEYSGQVVYACDPRVNSNMYPAFTETTEIHAIRMDGMDIDQNVTVMVYHLPKLDVLNSIDACMTAWYKTEEGGAAWEYSCGDYNIGDWLCGAHPSDEFTANYGFLLDAGRDHKVIEIDFDRILGDAEEDDDEA